MTPLVFRRHFSTRLITSRCRGFASGLPSPCHSIYISKSTDPYFNLTLEDWLFRHKLPTEPLLLIYRDDPCVVIGRNQNPWKEIDMAGLRRSGIPFIRRRSGGGTVYHDLGNTNFSIHLPRPSFDRHVTAQIVLRAIRSMGIDARINERNDICVGNDKIRSAYKIVNKRAYHHGTMLISTQLNTLGDLLRTNKDTMITKGVASVRSPVCNLQQFSTNATHDVFTSAVVDEFRKEYGIDQAIEIIEDDSAVKHIEYIRKGMAELPSWEWAYGQTPEFTYTISHSFTWGDVTAEIRSKHGLILSCSLQVSDVTLESSSGKSLADLGETLEGKRYSFVDGALIASNGPKQDVGAWLMAMMET